MRRLLPYALVPLVMLLLVGCAMKENKAEAERLGNRVFEHIMAEDYEKAADLYSEEFYSKVDRDEWIGLLKDINSRLGGLEGYKLSTWKVSRKFGFGGGSYFLLLYKTKYGNEEAEETLTMYRQRGGEITIKAHNISSLALVEQQT